MYKNREIIEGIAGLVLILFIALALAIILEALIS